MLLLTYIITGSDILFNISNNLFSLLFSCLTIKAKDEHWLVEWKEIKFEIIEVYKGNKWSDVAITEIHRVQH